MHYLWATITILSLLPTLCFGQVIISEIMYDVSGTDTGREWIELQNTGNGAIQVATLKLLEANVNHSLAEYQGSTTLSPGAFIIVADDPVKFKTDWPNFAGAILNSSFSLSNEGESLSIKEGDTVLDQVSYSASLGATGDGNALVRSGTTFVSATPTPGATNASGSSAPSNTQTTSGSNTSTTQSASNTSSSQTSSTQGTSNTGTASSPIVPQIYADAGEDKSGVVGASVLFSGKAYGLKKEPLTNARLIWNFGDGATAEGVSVLHTYALPGNYTVFLDVASGEYTVMDKVVATVVSPSLTVTTVVTGQSGYASITNSSAVELDLSRWYLRDGTNLFLLPRRTIVSARGTLTIPNTVSGLYVTTRQAELLYPNGEVAHRFTQPVVSVSPIVSQTATTPKVVEKVAVAKSAPVAVAKNSQAAGVGATTESALGGRSEVLSVSRKSDSVALWILGLSGFVAVIFGGMWFAHRKSLAESAESELDDSEEDEFEIVH